MNDFFPMDLPRFDVALKDCRSGRISARLNASLALAAAEDGQSADAIAALAGLLDDDSDQVRAQAVEGLVQWRLRGMDVPVDLRPRLADPSPRVRCALVEHLHLFCDDAASLALPLTADPIPGVRACAVQQLHPTDAEAARRLQALLEDTDWDVRMRAAIALGGDGGDRGFAMLARSVRDADAFFEEAVCALARICDARGKSLFEQRMKGLLVSPAVKSLCAAALLRFDNPPESTMIELLRSRRSRLRMHAIQALCLLPSPLMVEPLQQLAVRAADPQEASLALAALAALKDVDEAIATAALAGIAGRVHPDLQEELADIRGGGERNGDADVL
jgi:HEAT repeat protein